MRIKFLIGLISITTLFLFFLYIFVLPPKTVYENFSNSPLAIKFDKPVDRQKLKHEIIPNIYGEWKFEDPLLKNHLFRTLTFIPAVDFDPGVRYQVRLENIISPFSVGPLKNSFVSNFKMKEAVAEKTDSSLVTILDIPLDWQDHPLSCEAASLKMALASKEVFVSEKDIMEKIGYDPTPRKDGIWGDPYQAFVGNIDGKICDSGYGVYWDPIAKAANSWRQAQAFSDWKLQDLTREIESGNPIIVWGTLPVDNLTDCSWRTPEGKNIKAFKETHVRLVIGFVGDAKNPSKIIINDPLSGTLYWPADFFLTNWKSFGYSGVVIK